MRKLYLLSCISIFLTSCFRYQYMTVNSAQMAKNNKNEFVVENDSFRLVYNFRGQNVPVNITFENKLDQAITVDWRQSALVVNDKATSYVAGKIPIDGSFDGSSFSYGTGFSSTSGNLSATATIPGQMDFIPPHTYVSKTLLSLTGKFFDLPAADVHREPVLMSDGTTRRFNVARYNSQNSPLKFRSFITLVVGDSVSKKLTYEHSFYVEEFLNTASHPSTLQFMTAEEGNTGYVNKASGTGIGLGVAATAVFIGAAALGSKQIDGE